MLKVLGLILELNPFHNGHRYFIKKAIEEINPDVTIAVVSSSFTMRGEPVILDKFTKTKLLLNEGIDIVLELPLIYANNSSDFFTNNAISILKSFNVTDICFGAEDDNLNHLYDILKITQSKLFFNLTKDNLDKGYSYTTASLKALKELTDDENIIFNYPLPNNTLAIGYLKAINNSTITPHVIKRIDNNYYDTSIVNNKFNSASAIREAIKNNQNIKDEVFYDYDFYNPFELELRLFLLLKYFLLSKHDYNSFALVNEGIENRILSFIDNDSFDSFISNVQTKRYPINKIKRTILNMILEVPKKFEHNLNIHNDYCYLRIMGLSDEGKKYLSKLPKSTKNLLITSFKNISNEIAQFELKATKLYGLLVNKPLLYKEEYNIPFRKE